VTSPVRRSPMSAMHGAEGAWTEERAGWEIVRSYGDPAAEGEAIRGKVGLGDVTPRGKVDVRGAIEAPLRAAGDGIVARIADDWALVLTGPGEEPSSASALELAAEGSSAMVTDVTHAYAGLALAGPAAGDAFARLTSWDPETLEPGAAAGASFAEVPAVIVRRHETPGVLEVFVGSEFGRYAWVTVARVAARLGGRAVGWDALVAEGWS
jgi:glycine cleavage system aminomethyltransferase T